MQLDLSAKLWRKTGMDALVKNLAAYGEYHRDRRNVATHLVGIPMIVLAVEVLLARPLLDIPVLGVAMTPSMIASALAAVWYLQLGFRVGLVMTVVLAVLVSLGKAIAAISTLAWLGGGAALFVIGWAFQFLGHHYEGRKPAFVDDLKSLLVGPLFVVAELAFMLGLWRDLRSELEKRAA